MTTTRHRVAQTVRTYDAQGIHRTGTQVDLDSAQWLVEQARDRGQQARLEPFSLNRVIPGDSFIEIGGNRIDGFPLFDGTFTDEAGVQGSLGVIGTGADIAVVDFAPSGPDALNEARRSGRHAAIVGVVPSDPPGLAIRNAPNFTSPFGPPVLQVSSAEQQRLLQAADAGTRARLVAHATTEKTDAQNVIVEIAGKDADLPPLVIMTPRSGWFNCAIERGGGIACWLEIMTAFQNEPPNRSILFIATSGHELGHLGLGSFIKQNPDLPTLLGLSSPPSTTARRMAAVRLPLVAAGVLLAGFCIAGVRRTGSLPRGPVIIALLVIGSAAMSIWIARYTRLSREKTEAIVTGLLHNIYRAFDYREEEEIYDVLERSVTGDLLTQIYLETRRGLVLANQGGARAKVKEIEVTGLEAERGAQGGFHATTTWIVSGSVGHWGHIHQRRNQYQAELDITPLDGAWKLTGIEVLQEERL